jgi:hypothetical protein
MIDLNKLKKLAEAAAEADPYYAADTNLLAFKAAANPAVILELLALASAAQDSIPSVKPWEQRMGDNAASGGRIGSPQQFMAAEIADWRAKATAQDSAPAELPRMPEPFGVFGEYKDEERDVWDYDQMREYGQSCAAAALSRPVVAQSSEAFKEAFMEWIRKTDWVQDQIGTFPPNSLGMHRADIMRKEIERLRAALTDAPASPQPVAKVLSDQEILDICDQIWHTDYQDDTRGYDLAIARAVLAAASTPTTLTEKKE